jgi:hypothetical protein
MKLSPVLLLTIGMALISPAQEAKPPGVPAQPSATKPATKAAATPPAAPTPAPAAPAKLHPKVRSQGSSPLDALFKLVEMGRTHEGVRYPLFEDGVMTSMIISERMTRRDENLLEMENAVIDQRADDPIKFYLERATFNRQTDQLLSSQPTRIEGKTYEIEGDTMSYDRKNNIARLDGRVRMIVYDTKAKQPPADAKPAKPAPPTDTKAAPATTK